MSLPAAAQERPCTIAKAPTLWHNRAMARMFCFCASVLGFLGVAIGAFGAHALKARLSQSQMAIFQTGVQYHFVHTLALFCCALCVARTPHAGLVWAGWLLISGVVIFSGSLYALALTEIRVLGAVTPLGGLAFLAAWACLAWSAAASPPG